MCYVIFKRSMPLKLKDKLSTKISQTESTKFTRMNIMTNEEL